MPPKNVIVLTDHGYINGGIAKVAIDSAVGLADRGIRVLFFCACGPPDQRLQHKNIEVLCLEQKDILDEPSRLTALSRGLWNRPAARRLRSAMSEFSPHDTVIHCHGVAKALSASVGPEIFQSKLPHIFSMHEYFLACPNGGFFDYQAQSICRRKPLGMRCLTRHCDARKRSHKIWRVARQAILHSLGQLPRGLRHIIYISQTQLRAMQPYLPKQATLHHVTNPIECHQNTRADVKNSDIFLFIGRLNPEKGCLLFAEAARTAGIRSVFVGDGPMRDEILKLNPQAEITGWQAPEEVQSWLNRSRCLVFPSLWYEGNPLVPLEAAARGVPPVAGSYCAAAESIDAGKTGEIFDIPNSQNLAEVLKTMTPQRCDRLGSNAFKKFWESPPNLEKHLEQLTHAYEHCMHERLATDAR
jgi:glycosyltransferase involved in cell wall biosynthesis